MKYISKQMLTNYRTGKSEHIVVKGPLVPAPDFLVGGGLIIGGLSVLLMGAFKSGADSYDASEMEAMQKLDIVGESIEDFN